MLIIIWLIKAILFFLLFIAVILIVVLCIPVKYSISGKKDDDSQLSMNISWAFNLIKVVLFYQGGSKPKTDFIIFGHGTSMNGNSKTEKKTRSKKEKKRSKKRKNAAKKRKKYTHGNC